MGRVVQQGRMLLLGLEMFSITDAVRGDTTADGAVELWISKGLSIFMLFVTMLTLLLSLSLANQSLN